MYEFMCVLHKNGWFFFHLHVNWKIWQTSQKIHQPSKFPTSQFQLKHRNKSAINVATREPFFCHFPGYFWWMQHTFAPQPSPCAAPPGGVLVLYWTFDSPIQAATCIFSMCKIILYLNPQWGYLSIKRNTCSVHLCSQHVLQHSSISFYERHQKMQKKTEKWLN